MKSLVRFLISAVLLAHDWYPPECCNGNDCIQVPCAEVADGKWQGRSPGSHRPSPDGKCHICIGAGGRGKFYCMFTPEITS